jgi:hypothetical protein
LKYLLTALALSVCFCIQAERIPRHHLPAGWPWDTIPQVADGASWKTSLVLVNMRVAPSRYKVNFYGDDGEPKSFRIVSRGTVSTLSGTLPIGGSIIIETEGTGTTLNQGWAELDLLGTDNVAIMAIFGTSNIPGRPDFEATVSASTSVDFAGILPFDNTRGYATSVALLNPAFIAVSNVPVTIFDEAGIVLAQDTIRLAPGNKIAFATATRWPQTANKRGAIHFDGALQAFTIMGLRFHPGGAFTTINLMDK